MSHSILSTVGSLFCDDEPIFLSVELSKNFTF